MTRATTERYLPTDKAVWDHGRVGSPGRPPKKPLATFGKRVRALAEARGYKTRTEFFTGTDTLPGLDSLQRVQPTQFYRYESGEDVPPVKLVQHVADLLGTSTDFLLDRVTDPRPYEALKTEIRSLEDRVAEAGHERLERDEDAPSESLLIWERTLAPRSYIPTIHRPAMMATMHRYPPSDAWRWTGVYQDVTTSSQPSAADAAEMDAARQEADRLGAKKPPKKAPRRRGAR